MPVYACSNHDGHWPVPVASVVVAANEAEARNLLDAELASRGLKTSAEHPYTLKVVERGTALVISDGNY